MGLLASSWVEAAITTNNIPETTIATVLRVVLVDSWAWRARSLAATTLRAVVSMDQTRITAMVEAVVRTAAATSSMVETTSNTTALTRTKATVAAQVVSSVPSQAVTSQTMARATTGIHLAATPALTLDLHLQPLTSRPVSPTRAMARTLAHHLKASVLSQAPTTRPAAIHHMGNKVTVLSSKEAMEVINNQPMALLHSHPMAPLNSSRVHTVHLLSNMAVTTLVTTAALVALLVTGNHKVDMASLKEASKGSNPSQDTATEGTTSSSMDTEDKHLRWLFLNIETDAVFAVEKT